MEAKEKVRIKSLEPYRHLFPKATAIDHTVKKGASVKDTVNFIPVIARKTAWQVKKYVDTELKGLPTYEACQKLWNFVKYHIEYRPDKRGLEQVRSGRRLIHDGYGDCDCGTNFIASCLYALQPLDIPYIILRITKYKEDRFQHIYPVVPLKNGKEIIMDFVVHAFNYEEPYTEKEDYKMDLQFLDGIDGPALAGVDSQDLFGDIGDIGELGQLLRKARRGGGGGGAKPGLFKKKTPEQKKQKKEQRKEKIRKVANKLNRINAGAALLRAGILASMKLNIMKVAERLKWGYAPKEHAVSKGMNPATHDKLKNVLARAEKIFFTAGGKPENLRKAILTGRGNRSKDVAGFDGMSENTSLPQLLGAIYNDEFAGMEGFEGLDGEGLGVEPASTATAAAITAATGVMAAIAGLLKQVGVIFPKKEGEQKKRGLFKRKDQGEQTEQSSESSESTETESSASEESSSESESQSQEETSSEESSGENLPAPIEDNLPAVTDDGSEEGSSESSGDEEGTSGIMSGLGGIRDFYQKNKKWIVPVGILGVAITLGLIINHYASKSENKPQPQPQPLPQPSTVNGIGKGRGRKKKGGRKGGYGKQSVLALM